MLPTCPEYAPDMPPICPKYATNIPPVYPQYATDMPSICPHMLPMWSQYAPDMPPYAPKMPGWAGGAGRRVGQAGDAGVPHCMSRHLHFSSSFYFSGTTGKLIYFENPC